MRAMGVSSLVIRQGIQQEETEKTEKKSLTADDADFTDGWGCDGVMGAEGTKGKLWANQGASRSGDLQIAVVFGSAVCKPPLLVI